MRILVGMDEPARINPRTDTTLVLIAEARSRGHSVEICTPAALWLEGGEPRTTAFPVIDSHAGLRVGEGRGFGLEEVDLVWMRKDPPFDLDYYFATLLLSRAK